LDPWTPTLALERFSLTSGVWSLAGPDGVQAPQLRLRPDRRLACCPRPELAGWDVRDARLVLLDRAGRAVAAFDEVEHAEGRTVFHGARLDAPDDALTLHETAPVEAAPARDRRHAAQPLTEDAPRRHLLVADANGLPGWDDDLDAHDRSFDVCALDAGDEAPDAELEAAPGGAGRWDALHALFFPASPLNRYDFVAFAAPGLAWRFSALNEAFARAHAHDLLLAHPAIAGAGDPRLAPVPGRGLGFGTPVSLHLPILSAEALAVCAPTFALDAAGTAALPMLWTALLGAPLTRIAVLDGLLPLEVAGPASPPPADTVLLARFGLAPWSFDAGALAEPA
jgi:hypothetical protein